MLGVLLPALSRQFGLGDDTAGLLFLLQFLGASSGALVIGANYVRWLTIGYGLLVASASALAFAGLPLVFPVFYFFGLGLGITMTATSLVFSDRYREDCAAKLQRLNFAWAIGATTAPTLFLPYLRMTTLRPLFFTFVGLFLALLIWVLLRETQAAPVPQPATQDSLSRSERSRSSLLLLVVLATCSAGIEAALSGWLTTYSNRAGQTDSAGIVLAISLFWVGMTFSRFVF